MGLLDKLKNALFEVEYVEVEEPVKKEKKVKSREKEVSEKPIAKKIVLPGKKEEKVEEIKEEELKDDNFEVRPKDETLKNTHDGFKFMDDNDFKVDNEEYVPDEPEILEVLGKDDEQVATKGVGRRKERQFNDDEGFKDNKFDEETYEKSEGHVYSFEKKDKYYNGTSGKSTYSNSHETKPYGVDNSLSMYEYGTYERKEEKTYFKPSPIISPIYGILDKNYKKEDVVQKKEIRLTTGFSRNNVSVDDIRNKAYGDKDQTKNDSYTTSFEVEEEDDDNLLVDLSDDEGKPEVKDLTMGDALEYFQDLGLEYNVDYMDVSKGRNTPKREKDSYDDLPDASLEDDLIEKDDESVKMVESKREEKVKKVVKKKEEVVHKEESKVNDSIDDDDDNLFDLIDSMYQENE